MLSDRDYMRRGGSQPPPHPSADDNPNMAVYVLIAINALVFFAVPRGVDLYDRLALSPEGIRLGMYWQLVTSMFMHGGFGHILMNMWGLYLFGTLVAPHMRVGRFLAMYFTAGILGNLLWLAFNWNSYAFVVGASGALFGVLIAAAMFEPNRQFLLLLFPIPMKTKTLVAIYAFIEVVSVSDVTSGIAHLVHIGGLIGGYLFIRIFCSKLINWEPLSFLMPKKTRRSGAHPKGWTVNNSPFTFTGGFDFSRHIKDPEATVSQKELDYLLDKVSREGINSLTDAEMATLRKAREQMRRR
jgi:membrane associated rhomboid family serine protease